MRVSTWQRRRSSSALVLAALGLVLATACSGGPSVELTDDRSTVSNSSEPADVSPTEPAGGSPTYSQGPEPFRVGFVPDGFGFLNRQHLGGPDDPPDEHQVRFTRFAADGTGAALVIAWRKGNPPSLADYARSSPNPEIAWDETQVNGHRGIERPGEVYWLPSPDVAMWVTVRYRGDIEPLAQEDLRAVARGVAIK